MTYDSFVIDRLPPRELLPEFHFDLPAHIQKQAVQKIRRHLALTVFGELLSQFLSFLQGLPPSIPVEACRELEDVLELEKRNDDHFLSYFYAACIASGYKEILPRVEIFLEKIGRMLYIMPIGRALVASDWARDQARSLFERVRERHHPMTVNAVNGFLQRAGL